MNKKKVITPETIAFVQGLIEQVNGKISGLVKFGFLQRSAERSMSRYFYYHAELGIVVKRPFVRDMEIDIPECAVETVIIEPTQKDDECYWQSKNVIYVQPFVDTSRQNEAYKELKKTGYEGEDFCDRNVGHFEGKPVVFDW